MESSEETATNSTEGTATPSTATLPTATLPTEVSTEATFQKEDELLKE